MDYAFTERFGITMTALDLPLEAIGFEYQQGYILLRLMTYSADISRKKQGS
jgi:hypothetical protein